MIHTRHARRFAALAVELGFLVGSAGCLSPLYDVEGPESAIPEGCGESLEGMKVLVLPVTGLPAHDASAGEWFAHELALLGSVRAVSPIELELLEPSTDWGRGEEAAAVDVASACARLEADVAIRASISLRVGPTGHQAACDVVVAGADGAEIARYTSTCGFMIVSDNNHFLMKCVRRAAGECVHRLLVANDDWNGGETCPSCAER